MKISLIALLIASLPIVSSCAQRNAVSETGRESSHGEDIFKAIDASIDDGNDPTTSRQSSYVVSWNRRLLIKLESVRSAQVKIAADKPMRLRFFVTGTTQVNEALRSLRLCPVLASWSEKATWTKPQSESSWIDGGHIAFDQCIAPEGEPAVSLASSRVTPANDSTLTPCFERGAVCFEIGSWYRSFPLRGIDHGLALISQDGARIQILGETAAERPRVRWTE